MPSPTATWAGGIVGVEDGADGVGDVAGVGGGGVEHGDEALRWLGLAPS